jgi:hypothetical protein
LKRSGRATILTASFPNKITLEGPVPRRRRMVQGVESSQDMARKLEVLERELAVQRTAMEKLKQLGPAGRPAAAPARPPRRKSA